MMDLPALLPDPRSTIYVAKVHEIAWFLAKLSDILYYHTQHCQNLEQVHYGQHIHIMIRVVQDSPPP